MLCYALTRGGFWGKIEGRHKRGPHTQVWRAEEHPAKGNMLDGGSVGMRKGEA